MHAIMLKAKLHRAEVTHAFRGEPGSCVTSMSGAPARNAWLGNQLAIRTYAHHGEAKLLDFKSPHAAHGPGNELSQNSHAIAVQPA